MFKKDYNSLMHKNQKKMLKYAKEIGKNHGINLKYDDVSIDYVDQILVFIAKECKDEGIVALEQLHSNDGVLGIAESIGCYIVECIERKHTKGKWVPNENSRWPGYALDENLTVYPMEWVINKLIDPKGYSLSAAFKECVKST